MQVDKYVRKPFFVKAIRVSEENIQEVADWCKGETMQRLSRVDEHSAIKSWYIKVPVNNPLTIRHTKAFVGDWILEAENKGYKIYTDKAFARTFDKEEVMTKGTYLN